MTVMTCQEENELSVGTTLPIDDEGMIEFQDSTNLPPCPEDTLGQTLKRLNRLTPT